MRVEELSGALREAAEAQDPVDDRLDDVVSRHRRHGHMTRAVLATAVAVVVLVAVVATRSGERDDSMVADQPAGTAVAGEWERLPDPPLPPRSNTVLVWTGAEVLAVAGNTFSCPPYADCPPPLDPALDDGAAFDPLTRTWRPIADSPIGFDDASTAVVGDDVYFLVRGSIDGTHGVALLRYSIVDDTWTELDRPPNADRTWYSLVATDDSVLAVDESHEVERLPDLEFDPDSGTWNELPPDPLAPSFGRSMAWIDGQAYLFAHDLVENPGSDGPSLVRVARFDPATQAWEELPHRDAYGLAGVPVDGVIVNPSLDEADGGEVNPWDRPYPDGGIYDPNVPEWRPLPEGPDDEWSIGVIGRDRVWTGSAGNGGVMLDLVTDTWIDVPGLDDGGQMKRHNLIGTDHAIVAVGGERWDDGMTGEILDEAWILTFDR